jgi:hypothetical protein
VRIRVVVGLLLQKSPVRLEALRDRLVRVEHVLPSKVGDVGQELAGVVDRDDDPDAVLTGDDLVVFTVRRCLVNDSRSSEPTRQ